MNKNETGMLYNTITAIAELNKVDGFDPSKLLRTMGAEGEAEKLYMDVANRKLWFRLKYPNGKIERKVIEITSNYAVIEARVYADRNDDTDKFLSNALACRHYNASDVKFGDKFVEVAETAAVGRALADAGFGVQFCDVCEGKDPTPVDAGIEIPADEDLPMVETAADATVSSVKSEEEAVADMPTGKTPKVAKAPKAGVAEKPAATTPEESQEPILDNTMPYEELLSKITVDYAANKIYADVGFYKGKKLGEIAVISSASLNYYKNKSPSNIVRAGAQVLIDAALQTQAQAG